MSLSKPGSSPLSSPSSFILGLISAEDPGSPTPSSSQSALGVGPSKSVRSPPGIDGTCDSKHAPKRDHDEIEKEENSRKYRATGSHGITMTVAEQALPNEAKGALKVASPQKPMVANQPSRARNPPNYFWMANETDHNLVKSTKSAKKSTSKVFDPIFITSNSTSRLGKADVYHMLLEDQAWSSLSSSQQKTLLSMLPPSPANQNALDRIADGDGISTRPQAFTISNDCFRTDVAKFKADLQNGHLAKTWQAAAEQAAVERSQGKYDEWKAEEAELWWGQKSK